jgi:elongation factor Ts
MEIIEPKGSRTMNDNTVEVIKQLRAETGAGIMECRKALEQAGFDMQQALSLLRQAAALRAQKTSERQALEGRIELYSHADGRIGVMVEVNTETEFASRSEAFRKLAREIALHITSAAPLYVRDEDIPSQVLDELTAQAAEKARLAGKPERILEQITAGVLEKYKNKFVLERQPYIRDETITVAQLVSQVSGTIGEKVAIRRFVRWEIHPDGEATANP